MDWREYIQEKELYATPQPGHLAALVKAMRQRPGKTAPDRKPRPVRKAATEPAAPVRPVAQMSFDEYRAMLAYKNTLRA